MNNDDQEIANFIGEQLQECDWIKIVEYDMWDPYLYITLDNGKKFTIQVKPEIAKKTNTKEKSNGKKKEK